MVVDGPCPSLLELAGGGWTLAWPAGAGWWWWMGLVLACWSWLVVVDGPCPSLLELAGSGGWALDWPAGDVVHVNSGVREVLRVEEGQCMETRL